VAQLLDLKDEILQNMNLGTDEKQEEINYLTSEMSDSESQIKEKDEKIKNLEEKVEKYASNMATFSLATVSS
jgi:peptidoglycan hydrolase CwlO-like protein